MPGIKPGMTNMKYALAIISCFACAALARAAPAFDAFLQSTWPDARSRSASRAPPSTKRHAASSPICRCPISPFPAAKRLSPSSRNSCRRRRNICASRLSIVSPPRAKNLAVQYRDTLARIEKKFGVPGNVVLAIWARETDYGA